MCFQFVTGHSLSRLSLRVQMIGFAPISPWFNFQCYQEISLKLRRFTDNVLVIGQAQGQHNELYNVDRTHSVLASGKLVLAKKISMFSHVLVRHFGRSACYFAAQVQK